MKNQILNKPKELSLAETIQIEGGILRSASLTNATSELSNGNCPFNKDWGWIGSGPGDQGINL